MKEWLEYVSKNKHDVASEQATHREIEKKGIVDQSSNKTTARPV